MTDLEISKALALAIGWTLEYMAVEEYRFNGQTRGTVKLNTQHGGVRIFDYRDWNVIGPIAERYDVFPYMNTGGTWKVHYRSGSKICKTPQEAIAQAVIGAPK